MERRKTRVAILFGGRSADHDVSVLWGDARVDFFVSDEQVFIDNEANTLPGFTNISMYPKLWEASGLL